MSLAINGSNEYRVVLATGKLWPSTMTEIIGSFLLVFMYLCSTEEKTKFTKDHLIQTIVLSGSYLAAMNFAGSYTDIIFISTVNPAVALTMILFNPAAVVWKSFWIYTLLGYIGSLAAYVFFRVIYIRTIDMVDEIDKEEAEMEDNNKDALLAE